MRWSTVLDALASHSSIVGIRRPVLRERGQDPWRVLVSIVVSQRTRDEVTERVTRELLKVYPTPRAVARAGPVRVARKIREAGIARRKARSLVEAAKFLEREFDGRVPFSESDLLRIPGVGPKAAHAILVFGFEKPALPVDAHILRVTKRLGVVSPEATIPRAQRDLAHAVPKPYWHLLNPVLVQHGMNVCSPRAPKCDICPITSWCARVGVPGEGQIPRRES